jgi:hypothetical protein
MLMIEGSLSCRVPLVQMIFPGAVSWAIKLSYRSKVGQLFRGSYFQGRGLEN